VVRVLVVEEDDDLARLLELVLGDEGHAVDRVRSVRAGLALGWPSDVAVVDGLLASWVAVDGADLARLRALGARVPVVLTSTRRWVASADPATLGVAAVVPKPYDLESLLAAVRRAARSVAR
jgi:DNA-binding response OmpR family regulator